MTDLAATKLKFYEDLACAEFCVNRVTPPQGMNPQQLKGYQEMLKQVLVYMTSASCSLVNIEHHYEGGLSLNELNTLKNKHLAIATKYDVAYYSLFRFDLDKPEQQQVQVSRMLDVSDTTQSDQAQTRKQNEAHDNLFIPNLGEYEQQAAHGSRAIDVTDTTKSSQRQTLGNPQTCLEYHLTTVTEMPELTHNIMGQDPVYTAEWYLKMENAVDAVMRIVSGNQSLEYLACNDETIDRIISKLPYKVKSMAREFSRDQTMYGKEKLSQVLALIQKQRQEDYFQGDVPINNLSNLDRDDLTAVATTENVTSVDKPDFGAIKNKFYTDQDTLEQLFKNMFTSSNVLDQCVNISLGMRHVLYSVDKDDLTAITQIEYNAMRSVQFENESYISPLLLSGYRTPTPQGCMTTSTSDTITSNATMTSSNDLILDRERYQAAEVKKISRKSDSDFSKAPFVDMSAATTKKTARKLSNLRRKFINDLNSATFTVTFTLNYLHLDFLEPIYAKVEKTLANMSALLETIRKDFRYQVSSKQILSMSSNLETLTTMMQACKSDLDKEPEEALNSPVVYVAEAEDYTDDAAVGDYTVKSSIVVSGGDTDRDIIYLEHDMQPAGRTSAALCDTFPIVSPPYKPGHVLPELNIDSFNFLDNLATGILYIANSVTVSTLESTSSKLMMWMAEEWLKGEPPWTREPGGMTLELLIILQMFPTTVGMATRLSSLGSMMELASDSTQLAMPWKPPWIRYSSLGMSPGCLLQLASTEKPPSPIQ